MAINMKIDDLVYARGIKPDLVEFRADYNPAIILRSVCAFANDIDAAGGGYIIIGIESKNGLPVLPAKGISNNRINAIETKLREHCGFITPGYQPEIYHTEFSGISVIVIHAVSGANRPYKAPENMIYRDSPMCCFIRRLGSNVKASDDEERELFHITFDDKPAENVQLSDLDEGLMCGYLSETGSGMFEESLSMESDELADAMQLTADADGKTAPTNAAALMFCENAEELFPYIRTDVVSIPEPTGEGMTEKSFSGPIHIQLAEALAYIEENFIRDIGEEEPAGIYNYPVKAVREILTNAFYHRSYQINEPVTVVIRPDSMEITSLPGFDRCITDRDIADRRIYGVKVRNHKIGEAFKALGLIRGRNTGLAAAALALKENGSPALDFRMNPERDFITVIIPAYREPEEVEEETEETVPEEIIEDSTESEAEEVIEESTESEAEEVTEDSTESEAEEITEDSTETETEEVTEDSTESEEEVTEDSTESEEEVTEDSTESEEEIIETVTEAEVIIEDTAEPEEEEIIEPEVSLAKYVPEQQTEEADEAPEEITAGEADIIIDGQDETEEPAEEDIPAAEEEAVPEEAVTEKPKQSKAKTTDKKQAYEQSIKDILADTPLTLTELSKAMGYKGITGKLSKTVDAMVSESKLSRTVYPDGSTKLEVV